MAEIHSPSVRSHSESSCENGIRSDELVTEPAAGEVRSHSQPSTVGGTHGELAQTDAKVAVGRSKR